MKTLRNPNSITYATLEGKVANSNLLQAYLKGK